MMCDVLCVLCCEVGIGAYWVIGYLGQYPLGESRVLLGTRPRLGFHMQFSCYLYVGMLRVYSYFEGLGESSFLAPFELTDLSLGH